MCAGADIAARRPSAVEYENRGSGNMGGRRPTGRFFIERIMFQFTGKRDRVQCTSGGVVLRE